MASPTAAPRAACRFFCAAARNTADLFIEINFVPLQTADLFASAAGQCDQVDDCAVFAVRRVCHSVIISPADLFVARFRGLDPNDLFLRRFAHLTTKSTT